MYRYETHLHTSPVSKCARATVRESLCFYKEMGYAGVFVTNHFINGNINADPFLPYAEKIQFYFSDYEAAKALEDEIGIRVFPGVEMSYLGTDFLVYGLDKEWYLAHPEIEKMPIKATLALCTESGGFVAQAHPFREAAYIDHIRLFPGNVEAVEVYNASCANPIVNIMAETYAKHYGKIAIAGSDNHLAGKAARLGGVEFDRPIASIEDFIARLREGCFSIFKTDLMQKND